MTEPLLASPDPPLPAGAAVSTVMPGVLLVGDFLSASVGGRAVCEDLAERLPSVGFQVTTTSRHPARVARLGDMLWTTWSRRAEYQVAQVDVFSGLAFVWAEAATALLKRLGKPYALTLRGGELPEFAHAHPDRMERLLNGAGAITTPSPFLLRAMHRYREDLVLLPNPVDLSRYAYRPRLAPEPRLIWLRAFHEVYNPQLAVHVLANLLADFPEASLVMVGPDKNDGSLAETLHTIQELGLADRVEIVGGVPKLEVPGQLQRGDIFLNTSSVDNAPVTLLEPMACGIPVVSTNAGGIPDLVEDGREALLVPPNDPQAMTGAVRTVLEQPERIPALLEAALERVMQHDWSRVLPQWQALLSSLAKTAPTDDPTRGGRQ